MDLKRDPIFTGEDSDRLATALEEVVASLNKLRAEFAHYRDRTRLLLAAASFAVVCLLGLTLAVLINSSSNRNVIDEIRSCTTPGMPCYQRNLEASTPRTERIMQMICNATPPERRQPPCPPVN